MALPAKLKGLTSLATWTIFEKKKFKINFLEKMRGLENQHVATGKSKDLAPLATRTITI